MKDYLNFVFVIKVRKFCDIIVENLKYVDWILMELKFKYKYKMVLYKQIVDDFLGILKDIYNFVGFDMLVEIEKWIIESIIFSKKKL